MLFISHLMCYNVSGASLHRFSSDQGRSEITATRQTSRGTRASFCALQQGGLCLRETPSAPRPTASLLAPPEVATSRDRLQDTSAASLEMR
ncbi:hypothetical protein TNCT_693431 [Trichonephila clavata]|uniref:Uncharacterized protein n=1 Tax=Trichonephila clavata TaxID=2740835 RepID=A0A8X6LE09_TRICU|nr:hypothetical protein TNCT_693431 [Trichonephila clavata]